MFSWLLAGVSLHAQLQKLWATGNHALSCAFLTGVFETTQPAQPEPDLIRYGKKLEYTMAHDGVAWHNTSNLRMNCWHAYLVHMHIYACSEEFHLPNLPSKVRPLSMSLLQFDCHWFICSSFGSDIGPYSWSPDIQELWMVKAVSLDGLHLKLWWLSAVSPHWWNLTRKRC